MAALAAAMAGCRLQAAAAGWRAALCALQHVHSMPLQAVGHAAAAPCISRRMATWGAPSLSLSSAARVLPTLHDPRPQQQRQQGQQHQCSPLLLRHLRQDLLFSSASPQQGSAGSRPQRRAAAQEAEAALQAAGWSRREVLNIPNALSMARLLSGPVIASWILDGQVRHWWAAGRAVG